MSKETHELAARKVGQQTSLQPAQGWPPGVTAHSWGAQRRESRHRECERAHCRKRK